MNFGGLQLTTTLDYPGEIATILFTKGCNMKCSFCHNSSIASGSGSNYRDKDIFNKLMERKNKIDHIVISGGEPTIYDHDLIRFMIRLKNSGFKIKLDTNGLRPDVIEQIIRLNIADYIAMDIKTILIPSEYGRITGIKMSDSDLSNIIQSIHDITFSNIQYEFRTTVIKTYHNMDILKKLAELKLPVHFLQKFVNSDRVPDHSLESYTDDEMREITQKLKTINPNIELRGV